MLLASQSLATLLATLGGHVKAINDLRRWVAQAPKGTTVSTDALAEMLDVIGVELTTNKKGEARIGPPPMTSDRRAVGSRDHEPPTAKLTPAYMPI